jgi:hypothetical protein
VKATDPTQFKHTTLAACPNKIAGVTLLDEEPDVTGIYLRDATGGLWPARTVNRKPAARHRGICAAWLSRPGKHEDHRQ